MNLRIEELLDTTSAEARAARRALIGYRNEFDSNVDGRGDSYRSAQENVTVRWLGMSQLLQFCNARNQRSFTVLDVLGGDGTIAKAVAKQNSRQFTGIQVITGDISATMVAKAQAAGLPAIQQAAQRLLFKDESLDAVLISYGSHHIPTDERSRAVSEALRVVKPDGRVVLHDFAPDSPMANFFTNVVDRHTQTGHDYPHFTTSEMKSYSEAAQALCTIRHISDPYVFQAPSENAVVEAACSYIASMYGLERYFDQLGDLQQRWEFVIRTFDHTHYHRNLLVAAIPQVTRTSDESGYTALVPRVAVTATYQRGDS